MNVRRLLVLLLLVPLASGQINGPRDFNADYDFTDQDRDQFMTIVSGAATADVDAIQETWGFIGTTGLVIDGLEEVCHRNIDPSGCVSGDLRIVSQDGGSVAIKWATAKGQFTSAHTFGFTMTSSGNDLNSLILNETLVAPSIDGVMTFTDANAPKSPFLSGAARVAAMAQIVPLFDDSQIHVEQGGARIASLGRADGVVSFSGDPVVAPFGVNTAILPFADTAVAAFAEASPEAAREGISLDRIIEVQNLLSRASAGGTEQSGEPQQNAVLESLAEVLDAALIRVPTGNVTPQEVQDGLVIVFFDNLSVEKHENGLEWHGAAAFQYAGGEIKGAQELYGVWYVQLPWWGWLLWVAAIGLFVARLAVKPDPHHEKWDNYRWIGLIASIVMFVVVFILWDLEMRSVWGTSVLSTGTEGTAFWVTFGIQIATMSIVLGAVAWPIGIIVKNSLLLSKQGTFMGLGRPTALMLSYLLGATLFLAYLELIIQSVMTNAS